MSTMAIVIVILVVLAIIAVGFVLATAMRERRSKQLRSTFGPEYERAVDQAGDRQTAERELGQRIERRKDLEIRDLDPQARARYTEQWRQVQGRFVDDPRGAVSDADALVSQVMRERGYPTGDFDQQVADVSVDHAAAAPSYRSAHAVLLSDARGEVATDDLRQAMVHYRELFNELVGEPPNATDSAPAQGTGWVPRGTTPQTEAADDAAAEERASGARREVR